MRGGKNETVLEGIKTHKVIRMREENPMIENFPGAEEALQKGE